MDATENDTGGDGPSYYDGKICRACLEMHENMVNVFDRAVNNVYISVTNIEASPTDGLPPWICVSCVHRLKRFDSFRQRCRNVRYVLDAFVNEQSSFYKKQRLTKDFIKSKWDRLNTFQNDVLSYSNTLSIDVTSVTAQNGENLTNIHVNSSFSMHLENVTQICHKNYCQNMTKNDVKDDTSAPRDVKYEIKDSWSDEHRYEDDLECDKEKTDDGDDLYAVKLEEMDLDYDSSPIKLKRAVEDDDADADSTSGSVNYGEFTPKNRTEKKKLKVKKSKITKLEDLLVCRAVSVKRKKKKDRKKDRKREKLKVKEDVEVIKCEVGGELIDRADRPEISSRMVLETEQYKVIKLSREELVMEMLLAEKSERYLNAPYKCQMCVKGFNYEDVLANHMAKHSPENGGLECDLCHQFLPSAVSMRGHKKSHSTKYQCKRCLVVKASRQHLLEHYTLQHEGTPRTYICNVCGKTLTKRTMFQKHMRIHYPSTKIACDKCGKLFKTIETLRAHMLHHEDGSLARHADVKRYACDQCPKAFRYASLLYTHKVTHITTKDYYCVECDMKFKTQSNLKLHLRKSLKHIDPDMLRFGCSQCSRRYDDEKGLRHHVEWVHLRLKNYKCAKCEMQFGSQDGLRSHMKKIHEGVRPARTHTCDICHKAFRAKAVLVKHIRVHTGERPFECGECGKKFAQNSTMATHVKLVHLKMRRHVGARRSKVQQIESGNVLMQRQFMYQQDGDNR